MKPSGRFYDNLTRAMVLGEDGIMIQYSCFMTRDQRAAKTVRDLVLHYGGSTHTREVRIKSSMVV